MSIVQETATLDRGADGGREVLTRRERRLPRLSRPSARQRAAPALPENERRCGGGRGDGAVSISCTCGKVTPEAERTGRSAPEEVNLDGW